MRLDQLSQSERSAIREDYGKDELYKTMNALCRNLQPKMAAIDLLFEDIFVMSCSIMDDIKDDPDDFYDYHMPSIWEEIAGELRLFPKATGNDQAIDYAISTMLYIVHLCLNQWTHPDKIKYQSIIIWHFGEHRQISDEVISEVEKQRNMLEARGKTATLPNYLESPEYVSLDVDEQLVLVEEKKNIPKLTDESKGLTNAQIVLLFVEYLQLNVAEINVNALAKFLAAVTGRSQSSLYNIIKDFHKKEKEKGDELPFKQNALTLRQYLSNIHAKFKDSFEIYIED